MVFQIDEVEMYKELVKNSGHLGVATVSPLDIIQKLAQQERRRVTTIAYLKTYIHSPRLKQLEACA